MSKKSYSPANRIIANVLFGLFLIVGLGLWHGEYLGGFIGGGIMLAFAAFQFFVIDRLNNYEGY